MLKWIDSFPFPLLVIGAIFLGGAPFVPEPHIVEKLKMLAAGSLRRPLDIFDLCYHVSPLILLLLKTVRLVQQKKDIANEKP